MMLRLGQEGDSTENELIFKRRLCRTPKGQVRICLPKPIAEAFAQYGHIGLIWKAGSVTIAPWPQEDAA